VSEYKFKIVNGKLEDAENCEVSFNEYGLPVHIDDYGTGSIHWSLIKHKMEQGKRQTFDDVIWAVERLKFSADNENCEHNELLIVLERGYR